MIVLSVGMPKSGSAWYYNMTNDLLVAAGHQDARRIREKFHLHSTLKHSTCAWSGSRLQKSLVLIPHFCGHTFAIKSHTPPTKITRFLMNAGVMKATFTYRDPRDIVLAALERGQKKRSRGKTRAFSNLENIEQAIIFVHNRLTALSSWAECPQTLATRYEDLVANPVNALEELAAFLALDVPSQVLNEIVDAYQPQNLANLPQEKGKLHFNQGVVGRFRHTMTPHELDLCQKYFGDYLKKMGYAQT